MLRYSPQTETVIHIFLADVSVWHYGYDLSQRSELKSGTLYPILMRLESVKWLEAQWDESNPRRHLYRLTPEGVEHAKRWLPKPKPVFREAVV